MTQKKLLSTKRTSRKSKYLKLQNAPRVILFIVWCFVLLFAFYSGTVSYDNLKSLFSQLKARDSLILLLSPILSLLLSDLISADNKARLVFWKISNPLPGSIAFSELAPNDARIDFRILKQKVSKIPKTPSDQNALWYSLYRKYDSQPIVEQAHKYFLLSRDLAAIALLFSALGSLALVLLGRDLITVSTYCGVMLIHYVGLALVARNHGNRFVCNVLVEYVLDKTS